MKGKYDAYMFGLGGPNSENVEKPFFFKGFLVFGDIWPIPSDRSIFLHCLTSFEPRATQTPYFKIIFKICDIVDFPDP